MHLAHLAVKAFCGGTVDRRREQQIRKRLECSVGRDRAAAAFVLMPEIPQPAPEGLGRVVDQWLGWFVDCVIG